MSPQGLEIRKNILPLKEFLSFGGNVITVKFVNCSVTYIYNCMKIIMETNLPRIKNLIEIVLISIILITISSICCPAAMTTAIDS